MQENIVPCTRKELNFTVQGLVRLSDKLKDCGNSNNSSAASADALCLLAQWRKDSNTLVLKEHQLPVIRFALDEYIRDIAAEHHLLPFATRKRVESVKKTCDSLTQKWNL